MMRMIRYLAVAAALLLPLSPHAQDLDTESQVLSVGVQKDVPFVPTPQEVVDEMLRLAKVGKQDVLYDLGSGDGRIVVTAAKRYGARGVGIDIDPARIADGNANARKAGVEDKVRFVQGDLFKVDLREATAVTLYLLPSVNARLRPKLLAELKPGTPVVSHSFDMEDWEPDATATVEGKDIYAWVIPAKVGGTWELNVGGAPYRVDLRQKYQQATGTVEIDGKSVPVRSCKLNGNNISFSFADTVDGKPIVRQLKGTINGNKMTGNDWSAQRAGQPVSVDSAPH